MLGQRARPVRRAAAGKPAPGTVHCVPPPTRHLPFEQDAANLFFQLVCSRYGHASLIFQPSLPACNWTVVNTADRTDSGNRRRATQASAVEGCRGGLALGEGLRTLLAGSML